MKSLTNKGINIDNNQSIKQIIQYWDESGLCSPDSSTSHKNQYIASLDNFVESKLLSDILAKYCSKTANNHKTGLDIGAGLGRFTIILAQYLHMVYALEPAVSLYDTLQERCQKISNIKVINTSFESYIPSEEIDITIVSGILYLYSDELVDHFFNKLSPMVKYGGIIILRDFIVQEKRKTIPSSFIKNGYCYYRNYQYWKDIASKHDLKCVEVFRSTPLYSVLFNIIIRIPGINKIISSSFVKDRYYNIINKERQKGNKSLSDESVTTVFITIKKV